jgi:hypothetical protein
MGLVAAPLSADTICEWNAFASKALRHSHLWILRSRDELRPPPPPALTSERLQ